MSSVPSLAVACRLLLAASALLAGLDLHALESTVEAPHAPGLARATFDGRLDLHGDDCSHREHVPARHHAHDCALCHAGAARSETLAPQAGPEVGAARPGQAVRDVERVLPPVRRGGVLGARGPPEAAS